jgi:hypothetical protein
MKKSIATVLIIVMTILLYNTQAMAKEFTKELVVFSSG